MNNPAARPVQPAMISMTESECRSLSDAYSGICVGVCQKVTADGVEPDARKYKCPQCGEHTVYGIEEAVLMGHVEFVE